MDHIIVLIASTFVQSAAAFSAGRRIVVSERRAAWAFVTLGLGLMATRRMITLIQHLPDGSHTHDLVPEAIALGISVLMFAGVFGLGRVFDELEARAGALAMANVEKHQHLMTAEESRGRLRALFDHMHDAFLYARIIADEHGRPADAEFLEVNEAFAGQSVIGPADVVGKRASEVMPGLFEEEFDWMGFFNGVASRPGTEAEIEQYIEYADRWFRVTAYSIEPGRYACVFHDTTDAHLARADLERRVDEKTRQLEEINDRLQEARLSPR